MRHLKQNKGIMSLLLWIKQVYSIKLWEGKRNIRFMEWAPKHLFYLSVILTFIYRSTSKELQTKIRQLYETIDQVQDNNKEFQQSLYFMREERYQYRDQMVRQVQDMMMKFVAKILQPSQFITQDSSTTTNDLVNTYLFEHLLFILINRPITYQHCWLNKFVVTSVISMNY